MKNASLNYDTKNLPTQFLPCLLVFLSFILPVCIAGLVLRDAFLSWLCWIISGWLCWTFTEYAVHRFYMHHSHPKTRQKLYQSHMSHHKHPSHIKISFSQRAGMVLVGIILLYFSYSFHPFLIIFTGFFLGFIGYALMHWLLHQSWSATLFPRLQNAHIHHHGKYPDKCFGFSLIWWDYLFGTLPPTSADISTKFRSFYYMKKH
jgi:sterol desaturase/sphingolipid hydroxylase (fatty acid hydroxylase superfamily)